MTTRCRSHQVSFIAILSLLASAAVLAQTPMDPAMVMPPPASTSDTMPAMPMKQPGAQANSARAAPAPVAADANTHASDPALQRPAISQLRLPPIMPGMDMDDATNQHRVLIENLEAVSGNRNGGAWDAQAWYGGDFNKLWLKSEGERLGGRTEGSKIEALWAHALLPFWDTQMGVRYDFSRGPTRTWAALGVQGISPFWFDVEATAYVGEAGRTAARLKAEYDIYLTQRLILRPEIEMNLYGRADPQRQIGAGLSDGKLQLRLRYEFTRAFAPYLGFVWDKRFGSSATYARRGGDSAIDRRLVGGVMFFF